MALESLLSITRKVHMLYDKNDHSSIGGGRYLLEIDAIPGLSHLEYRILLRFSQGLNFKGNFKDWRYIHHETMATWLGSSRIEINKRIKRIENEGWIESRSSTSDECIQFRIDRRTLFYRLTEKVFSNYLESINNQVRVKNTHTCEKHTDLSVKNTRTLSVKNTHLAPPVLTPPIELLHVCEHNTHFLGKGNEEIPKNLIINVSEFIRTTLNIKFFDNNEAENLIRQVLSKESLTIEQFKRLYFELKNWEGLSKYFKLTSSKTISSNFTNWFKESEEIQKESIKTSPLIAPPPPAPKQQLMTDEEAAHAISLFENI